MLPNSWWYEPNADPMSLAFSELAFVMVLFFTIALLYASVGFGGGSSYLALLTLFLSSFFVIRSTALVCNLFVVGGSCFLFYKNGLLDVKRFMPFIVTSIPMAFLGASFRLGEHVFFILLGSSLICAAIALTIQTLRLGKRLGPKKYPRGLPYALGLAIGFLSGLVGIGGGIFLAPVLNQLKWDTPKTIAALASFFILVNSISGISGLWFSGTFELLWPESIGLLVSVVLGGQLGIRLGIKKISGNGIRLITAALVFFVGVRVLLNNGLELRIIT